MDNRLHAVYEAWDDAARYAAHEAEHAPDDPGHSAGLCVGARGDVLLTVAARHHHGGGTEGWGGNILDVAHHHRGYRGLGLGLQGWVQWLGIHRGIVARRTWLLIRNLIRGDR